MSVAVKTFSVTPHWKVPLTFSVMAHLVLMGLLFLIPTSEKRAEAPFITRLISPEELKREFPVEPPGKTRPEERMQRGQQPRAVSPPIPRAMKPSAPQVVMPRQAAPRNESFPAPVPPVQAERSEKAQLPDDSKGLSGPGQTDGQGGAASKQQRSPEAALPAPSVRERLFDQEVINRLAKREERQEDNSVTFDTKEFRYYSYMMKLKERIERIWRYPSDAAMRGLYGDLYISFTILKNGKLGSIELVRTSGNRSLDDAALKALRDAEPFWPLPHEWGKDDLQITGHFVYSLYGTHIR